jgi:hypothetical protein
MGDGRWEMGDGRWEMGDGRWEMGNGKWEMGNGANHEPTAVYFAFRRLKRIASQVDGNMRLVHLGILRLYMSSSG